MSHVLHIDGGLGIFHGLYMEGRARKYKGGFSKAHVLHIGGKLEIFSSRFSYIQEEETKSLLIPNIYMEKISACNSTVQLLVALLEGPQVHILRPSALGTISPFPDAI